MKNYLNILISIRSLFRIRQGVLLLLLLTVVAFSSCEKWLDVGNPKNALASGFVFQDEPGVQSAISGMYSAGLGFGTLPTTASLSLLTGLLSDDLTYNGTTWDQYKNNSLLSSESVVASNWSGCYAVIYNANAIIEGVEKGNFSASFKNQSRGEALFIRALAHFQLVNLYGDVPLITSTVVQGNQSAPRSSVASVYAQIVADLEEAAAILPIAYPSGSARVRANKWAATALLAKVYLYLGEYVKAEAAATQVIGANNLYNLPTDLTSVFLKTSTEAIFAFDVSATGYTATGNAAVPTAGTAPTFVIQPGLFAAFEANDKRKTNWISSSAGYNFLFKYRVRSGTGNEQDVVLRLAEQYLIRAEAAAQQNKFSIAESDINAVRTRAGLDPITLTNQLDALTAVAKERRVEFFAEWASRWFDLKRTKQVDAVVGSLKPGLWQSTDALFPVPSIERTKNSGLTQNPGYE